jgi:hypothetical protein
MKIKRLQNTRSKGKKLGLNRPLGSRRFTLILQTHHAENSAMQGQTEEKLHF